MQLTVEERARFVADGYLVIERALDPELCARIHELGSEGDSRPDERGGLHGPLFERFPSSHPLREAVTTPRIRGALESLVGLDPTYRNHSVHRVPPRVTAGTLGWHSDGLLEDLDGFFVQLMIFPHDTPREMGGTMVLPGSHLTPTGGGDIAEIMNFRGQRALVVPAGTIVIDHFNLWHCAQPNHTDRTRVMVKLAVGSSGSQRGLWADAVEQTARIAPVLSAQPPWIAGDAMSEGRKRARLWAYLCGMV